MNIFPMLVSVASFAFSLLHPLHVSVTEIEMDEKDKRLEIMMRVFLDDLETTLRKELNQPDFDIMQASEQQLDDVMADYIKKDFKVQLDAKAHAIKYLGHQQEGDAAIFYIEVSPVKRWKTIKVQNSVLHEAFGDQSNLVHVSVKGAVKSLRLTPGNATGSLTFDGN